MSIGPLGLVGSIAGAPLAQTKGAAAERAQADAAEQQSALEGFEKAAEAAGIGTTDGENHASEDRDADGRRLWEIPDRRKDAPGDDPPADSGEQESTPKPRSPSDDIGSQLDLMG